MSSNYVSSFISMSRGFNKALKGDKVAIVTTIGNAVKVVEKAGKVDTSWGEKASSIVEGFAQAAENNPALGVLSKFFKIAKKGDPIGMVVSGINAAKSETPARDLIQESCKWAGKIIVKGLVKKHSSKLCNLKGIKPIADSINKFSKNTKGFGQVPNIIAGCVYSAATIYATKAGKQIGKFISDKLNLPDKNNPVPIIDPKLQTQDKFTTREKQLR